MKELTDEIKDELKKMVYSFFGEECEVDITDLHDNTHIIDDLDCDSLMFIELLELIKKKYSLNIELQAIGKYLLRNPAQTIGQVIDTTYLLYEQENKINE